MPKAFPTLRYVKKMSAAERKARTVMPKLPKAKRLAAVRKATSGLRAAHYIDAAGRIRKVAD